MSNYKNGGLTQKYHIQKTNGKPVDPNADYFVLRIDKDPHAIKALAAYINSVRFENELLANDLSDKLLNLLKNETGKL